MKRDLGTRLPDDDLASFGSEGALAAARTFDPSHGVPFERWATLRIRGTILDSLRAYGPLPRQVYRQLRALLAAHDVAEGLMKGDATFAHESAEAADARVSLHLSAMATSMALGRLFTNDVETLDGIEDGCGTVEDEIIREELKARVRAAVRARPRREREILERYYFHGMTLKQASRGFSRSWSSRLLARATLGVGKTLRTTARAG